MISLFIAIHKKFVSKIDITKGGGNQNGGSHYYNWRLIMTKISIKQYI